MEMIIREKISADQLLYVSLKYTKTADVVLNLLARWKNMLELSINELLKIAKKKKEIKSIPAFPKPRLELVRKVYRKNPDIIKAMELYEFFKKIPELEKVCENEFRKNFTLRARHMGEWTIIDLEKLKEYSIILERFISYIKQISLLK